MKHGQGTDFHAEPVSVFHPCFIRGYSPLVHRFVFLQIRAHGAIVLRHFPPLSMGPRRVSSKAELSFDRLADRSLHHVRALAVVQAPALAHPASDSAISSAEPGRSWGD